MELLHVVVIVGIYVCTGMYYYVLTVVFGSSVFDSRCLNNFHFINNVSLESLICMCVFDHLAAAAQVIQSRQSLSWRHGGMIHSLSDDEASLHQKVL